MSSRYASSLGLTYISNAFFRSFSSASLTAASRYSLAWMISERDSSSPRRLLRDDNSASTSGDDILGGVEEGFVAFG